MKPLWIALAAIVSLSLTTAAVFAMPVAFTNRIAPGVSLGGNDMSGVSRQDVSGVLRQYEQNIRQREVAVRLNGQTETYRLADLGVTLDIDRTFAALQSASTILPPRLRQAVTPVITMNRTTAHERLHSDFARHLDLPRNASLTSSGPNVALIPAAPGQQVKIASLEQDIQRQLMTDDTASPLELVIISAEPAITDDETAVARTLVRELLDQGLTLTYDDETITMRPATVRRLLTFIEQPDSTNPQNAVLGVALDPEGLRQYLTNTLQPAINQQAINARFAMENGRVQQFDLPQRGQTLHVDQSLQAINTALRQRQTSAQLAVSITEPDVAEVADIEELGVADLLATGVSDFAGSPPNRIHNIRVGANKYHGLLIAPGEEYSFNKFLGPVNASNGFKPELVIKKNVTVPEYGGGLCQVSSTVFRAAARAGLEITERRSHSYAVQYYGTPGFDATIYPGYTDFRFLNNTPSYILIQTRIEGTKLFFDFWGTADGRSVDIDGPHPYDRQPSGAVKATLTQTVTRDGQTIIEDTFYSNYKSPNLFPTARAAGET